MVRPQANILVDNLKRACITDFGLSSIRADKTLPWTNTTTTMAGCSYRWAAPELLDDSAATKASDIWAFGSVCYEVKLSHTSFMSIYNHSCKASDNNPDAPFS